MTALSLSTPSATHLLGMSAPIGSTATVIDPASDFPAEGAVSATHPVKYFSVLLSEPALVVLRMQEANTASRCALFLSCTTSKPNANNASWRLISPEPVKQLVLHPADQAYRVGVLTVAVHYLETSGQSSFQLRVEVRRDFFAMWLRTGEVPRNVTFAGTMTHGTSHTTQNGGTPSDAVQSTLHGVLANAAGGSTTTAAATAAAASSSFSSSRAVHARGALFTSLYIGDWRGNQREGLGFQYYAAPDDVAPGDSWDSGAHAEDSEGDVIQGSAVSSFSSHPRPSAQGLPAAAAGATAGMTSGSISVADPLLLLRAFSERHNLPWSAWSIPATLTPEELSTVGFGHSFHLAGSGRLSRTPPAADGLGEAEDGRSGEVAAPASPTFATPASPHPSSDGASQPPTPPLPPSPPAVRRATAVEGLSVLGGVIDRLLLAEIHGAELGQWAVLPVQPGVEVYAGEWSANRKDGRGFYQWLDRSYVGEWVGGHREGFGLRRRKDGGWYRGQWEHHVPHGSGEARLMPGNLLYKGEWRDGCRSGRGCLLYPDGTAVHGVWVADTLLPDVHAVYAGGSTYDGVWGPDACRDGLGTMTDTAGCQHVHVWSHNARVGDGKEVYRNGVVLEGTWQDDVLVSGVYVFPNGDRYVGDVDAVRHVREGNGTCTSADGLSVYTGGWSNDQRTGRGVFVRHQKSDIAVTEPAAVAERYEGEWRNDVRCGAGHEENGEEVYEGTFADDGRDGTGVQHHTRTGSFYNGEWKAGHRCGAGSYYSATKDTTYEGVFLRDRLTGSGTATKGSSLEQYSGLWLDGVEQGHGSLRLANGDTLRGVWHRGQPQPDTAVEYTDAPRRGAVRDSRYVGGWRDGARHGMGTQVFHDGSVYEGAWSNNQQHGHGRRTAASGESVECEWVNGGIATGCVADVRFADGSVYAGQVNAAGMPHGTGVLTYPDGTVFNGQFTEGIYRL